MLEIKIFQIIALVFSAVIHEYMHGWTADRLGDPTAKNLGRLTLNPIPHLDAFGSVLLPLVLILTGSNFLFGWAKPVPYNPYNLRDAKYGPAKVALAGPLSNLVVALFFGIILRVFHMSSFMGIFIGIIVYINVLLMVINLIPIPPLDGSKIIMPFLPYDWQLKLARIEQYGLFLVLIFMFVGFALIFPVILFLFKLIVGTSFYSLFLGIG